MAAALATVAAGLERARRRIPAASALAVLQAVAGRPGARPSDLAEALDLHPSSVSRQVQALERAGQVALTADPGDRRSCLVALTPAGEDEIRRLLAIGVGRYAKFVADWDAAEVRTLTRLLAKFEASKARVLRQEQSQTPAVGGRHWQKQG
jgi:DNA-binding MarR family transcriptional regulator